MSYFKVEIYLPVEYEKPLIEALNAEGLLTEGNYDYVYAAFKIKGHFRPLKNANPFEGNIDVISEVDEVKIEFRIKKEDKNLADKIIKKIHPYEVPVINYISSE